MEATLKSLHTELAATMDEMNHLQPAYQTAPVSKVASKPPARLTTNHTTRQAPIVAKREARNFYTKQVQAYNLPLMTD